MEKVKLTDLCDIQYGYAFDSACFTDNNTYIPLIRIRDVKRGYSETFYTGDFSEAYIIHSGDLLIGMDGEFNIARWKSKDALLNQRVCKITANYGANEEYLRFALSKALKSIENKTAFVTVKHLSAKELNKLTLNIPSQEIQHKIATELGLIEKIISEKNKEILKLDELVKSRFVEMFGEPELNTKRWTKQPLSTVITVANNGMSRRGNDSDGDIVLRLVELQNGYIDYSNPNRIVLNEVEKKRYCLNDKDFLFARVNGNPDNVGRCAVYHDIGEPVYHNDHIIRVHFDEELLDGVFASTLLNSDYGKRQLKNQIKTSAGQYTVSQDGIGAIIAILPPVKMQIKFAEFVQEVDKLKFKEQNHGIIIFLGR